jgi:hypothetical protein
MAAAQQNYINHVVFELDGSTSMSYHAQELIRVVDAQIAHLARRSKELDQETRVTVYVFSDAHNLRCVIYDKDVLRMPSIRDHYRASGMTALIDATLLSLDDLGMTPEKYGDHAFLIYVLTDGQENRSRNDPSVLARRLKALPEHWTVAALVPDQLCVHEAKKFGFPANNIAIWNTNSRQGVEEVGSVVREATDRFMDNRSRGVRGSRDVFSTGSEAVNADTISAAALRPLPPHFFDLVDVTRECPIREFVERDLGRVYITGMGYYELTKTENIQPQKSIAVVHKATGQVFTGSQVRDLIGLPLMHVRVKPSFNPEYSIFVQSTSVNRKLIPGTKFLVLTHE